MNDGTHTPKGGHLPLTRMSPGQEMSGRGVVGVEWLSVVVVGGREVEDGDEPKRGCRA